MGIGFLTGFLPAFPIAMLAAGKTREKTKPLAEILWAAATFSVYFWASAVFILWKAQV